MRFRTHIVVSIFCLSLACSIRASGAETVLHQFSGPDGAKPIGALIGDASGNLYGTTSAGGAHNAGTVFELVYTRSGYTDTVLHSFTGEGDGGTPTSALVMDASGNLYGTAELGGAGSCLGPGSGCGVVFELVKSSGYSETVLYQFSGGSDGGLPYASIVLDAAGNLYGTTTCGGSSACLDGSGGNGVVFMLVKSSGYRELVLHQFSGASDGSAPRASVILDSLGNLYGTTATGGGLGICSSTGCGVAFKLLRASGYAETVLHRFTGESDGGSPLGALVMDASGNLYGTADCGGSSVCSENGGGDGVAFAFSASSIYTVLHTFSGPDGANPQAGLTLNSNILYGTTYNGGSSGLGALFQIETSGSGFSLDNSFPGGVYGAHPMSALGFVLRKVPCPSRCGPMALPYDGASGDGVIVWVLLP